jgi:hypothetical protein
LEKILRVPEISRPRVGKLSESEGMSYITLISMVLWQIAPDRAAFIAA